MNLPCIDLKEFVCPICLDIANDAVCTPCCHHILCESCSIPLTACPLDRTRFTDHFKCTPNMFARRIITGLPIECEVPGCGLITTRGVIKTHIDKAHAALTKQQQQQSNKRPISATTCTGTTPSFLSLQPSGHRLAVSLLSPLPPPPPPEEEDETSTPVTTSPVVSSSSSSFNYNMNDVRFTIGAPPKKNNHNNTSNPDSGPKRGQIQQKKARMKRRHYKILYV
eukprot:GEZU01008081.1.p1 GENE.GEZU01008081.1~~GEZU01008081.1.p1  ORF type:complete len:224 (-),score=32.71 GEZU01008081.1:210-881(-)